MCVCLLPARLSISFSCSRLTASSSPSNMSSASGFWVTTDWLRKFLLDFRASSSSVPVFKRVQVSSVAFQEVEGQPITACWPSALTVVLQGFERHVGVSRPKGVSHKPPSSPQIVLPVVQTPEVVQLAGGIKGPRMSKITM